MGQDSNLFPYSEEDQQVRIYNYFISYRAVSCVMGDCVRVCVCAIT